jgi:hypothetical protein
MRQRDEGNKVSENTHCSQRKRLSWDLPIRHRHKLSFLLCERGVQRVQPLESKHNEHRGSRSGHVTGNAADFE